MTSKQRKIWGTLFCGSAVVFGAFGAHLFEQILTSEGLKSYEVGVRFQFFHGLALLFLSLDNNTFSSKTAPFFIIGTLLFSGSIYGLLLSSTASFLILPKILGPVTPIGGLLLIFGWTNLLIGYIRS